jgi:hypothetical protein
MWARVGYDYADAFGDDHSRVGYAGLLGDERAATVTAFVERALTFFEAHGTTARRLMTDNARAYTKNGSLRELLRHKQIRHLTTGPAGRAAAATGCATAPLDTAPPRYDTGSPTTTPQTAQLARRAPADQPRSNPL